MSVGYDLGIFFLLVFFLFFFFLLHSLSSKRAKFFFTLVHGALKGEKRETTLSEIAGKYHFYKLSISHPLD